MRSDKHVPGTIRSAIAVFMLALGIASVAADRYTLAGWCFGSTVVLGMLAVASQSSHERLTIRLAKWWASVRG
jgi:hypothetical protein